MMFQLCNYRDSFFGYIIFEMGPMDIPLYDTMRMIISPSLYRILKSENDTGDTGEQKLFLRNAPRDEKKQPGAASAEPVRKTKKKWKRMLSPRKIVDCLSKNVDKPTDVSLFAKELDVSVSTLVRQTKGLTGFSVGKLHEKLKMEKAMALLVNREYSIAEIADKLGYANQFYFSSVFKRYTGMSPMKWLKQKNL
jgi:AraC-like DNA-binding protein